MFLNRGGEERSQTAKGQLQDTCLGSSAQRDSDFSYYKCYRYNTLGYIAKHCKPQDAPMQCNVGEHFCGSKIVPGVSKRRYPYIVPVTVNGKLAKALFASGSAITLVTPDFVITGELDNSLKTGITCIHGDVKYYPTTHWVLVRRQ